jgi:hypothetical protein
MTWFISYIYYCNLQFLNNVIIIKTKVPLPQAEVNIDDFDYPVFGPILFYCSRRFKNNFAFQYLDF